jgi:hypothetical protein
VREVEVELIMTPEVARSVANWLKKHADDIDANDNGLKEKP